MEVSCEEPGSANPAVATQDEPVGDEFLRRINDIERISDSETNDLCFDVKFISTSDDYRNLNECVNTDPSDDFEIYTVTLVQGIFNEEEAHIQLFEEESEDVELHDMLKGEDVSVETDAVHTE